jgi:antitoxin component of RelBE/YafQ-DinJ toxin-antitoxin module
MSELQLKLKEEAIKVYQETGLTPEKLLKMYKIAVSTLEISKTTMELMFNEEKKLQEKLSQQSEQLEKLVNQSESL